MSLLGDVIHATTQRDYAPRELEVCNDKDHSQYESGCMYDGVCTQKHKGMTTPADLPDRGRPCVHTQVFICAHAEVYSHT
jgi:hypothetical protein